MSVAEIQFDFVERNPYRDLKAHPIPQEQLEHLKATIDSTGFWEGLLVRPHPANGGHYQLAFGHARLLAAKECGFSKANFIIQDLDDDAMIRAMADENISQFGRDEYATYREAVTAAAERMMGQVLANPSHGENIFLVPEDAAQPGKVITEAVNSVLNGEAPGHEFVGRYFKGTLPLGPIRMALKEYRDSGKLAAWHAKHNPGAINGAELPTLSPEALNRFEHAHHVAAFAKTVQELGVPVEEQPQVADEVVAKLKRPAPKESVKSRSAHKQKRNVDYQVTAQPRDERLTAVNIRGAVTKEVARRKTNSREKARLTARAHAISVESEVVEMSIGLQRAARASAHLVKVAEAIGGIQVDLTMTTVDRLAKCREHHKAIIKSLAEVMKISGLNLTIGR